MTGLDGPSSTTNFTQSFPQPEDVEDSSDGEGETDQVVQQDGRNNDSAKRDTSEVREEASHDGVEAAPTPSPERKLGNRWLQRPRDDQKFPAQFGSQQSTSTFVTALSEARSPEQKSRRGEKPPSFVTALEPPMPHSPAEGFKAQHERSDASPRDSLRWNSGNGDSPVTGDGTNSRTSLLHHTATNKSTSRFESRGNGVGPNVSQTQLMAPTATRIPTGMVRFNVPAEVSHRGGSTQAAVSQVSRRRSWRYLRRGEIHPGEIVKTERMLVRIDTAVQQLPEEYNENDSIKTDSRTVEKWGEYVVVCRESRKDEESDFAIQLYKTRVIPALEDTHASKRCAHEIPLLKKTTNVNLYSSLDKTLVMWIPWKSGTKIFILRPRSASSSVEWYTFIRNALGWKRPQDLRVNVPDLSVTLKIVNPFSQVEAARAAASSLSSDETALLRSMKAEEAIASVIIERCVTMLQDSKEWAEVLQAWLEHEKMGLAWKRYDRLEWVHGANEQRMYGTLAMERSHELELRPKKHYPTNIKPPNQSSIVEPAPVEGFLVRLTSQRGRVQRLGKMFFKRLYFFTHNHYLCYCRPANALPPPPPKASLGRTSKIPSATEITENTPLIYAVNPYPMKDGKIEWLEKGTATSIERANEDAYTEAERRTNSLLNAEGYINMCQIDRIREVYRGSTPADANVDQGSDVDFHEAVSDSRQDDGRTDEFDDERAFELVLNNGLVVRLQAYNKKTKKEWMARLRKLIDYWKLRTADDMTLLKSIRQANLEQLDIDEEMEAHLGQFGEKWEVSRAVASPHLFNICGISCCRAITVRHPHLTCWVSPPANLSPDVRHTLPKTQEAYDFPQMRCHPLPRPTAHLPRHLARTNRQGNPSYPT